MNVAGYNHAKLSLLHVHLHHLWYVHPFLSQQFRELNVGSWTEHIFCAILGGLKERKNIMAAGV